MSFLISNTFTDNSGSQWRIATDGKNKVWQKLVPSSSDSNSKSCFATWGGQVPSEVKKLACDLSDEDFTLIS